MRFPVYFRRIKGSGADPTLGSDIVPASRPAASADNLLSHKLSRPMNRVAVGYAYEGGGTPVALPVSIFVWEETSGLWFSADASTLTAGTLTYLRCPALCDPPPIQANLGTPQHGVDVLIIVADTDPATAPDGLHHFVAAPDAAMWGSP